MIYYYKLRPDFLNISTPFSYFFYILLSIPNKKPARRLAGYIQMPIGNNQIAKSPFQITGG